MFVMHPVSILVCPLLVACHLLLPDPNTDPHHISNSIFSGLDYGIQQIVWRHQQITRGARNEVRHIDRVSRSGSSECIHEAVKPILETCHSWGVEGLTTDMRVRVAVILSVCEFESLGVMIPANCEPLFRQQISRSERPPQKVIDKCVLTLETKPQWWTTYSGNYQSVGAICAQESLPFEKDQILDLYSNITDKFYDFYHSMVESYQRTDDFSRDLGTTVEEINQLFQSQMTEMNAAYARQAREYSASLSEINQALKTTADFSTEVMLSSERMGERLALSLENINKEIAQVYLSLVEADWSQEIETLKAEFVESMKVKKVLGEDLLGEIIAGLQTSNHLATANHAIAVGLSNELSSATGSLQGLKGLIYTTDKSV
ncbi:hypothetical protein BABINDRAFT_14383 [Babjeviella inositovora NRRL Y-12698]|uniref:Nuclear fusion protein KAR5 n=1 Tax=Babjeviella inositovora NRRL Y-12698 TaxID=984486 RepID=A0A1E3QMB7_9ASCO|nr:uncharacterized protein BABINDRAFT_14383 [Babjeviella inositovora NRRL Y-12698]ODQ78758.1 hypothetical protein BABINDRAFT_14383 [Babjeviella inositovora NRRL Y-12698]